MKERVFLLLPLLMLAVLAALPGSFGCAKPGRLHAVPAERTADATIPGVPDGLPRPTVKPAEVAARLRDTLAST